jgi:type II secretory pathway component PulF
MANETTGVLAGPERKSATALVPAGGVTKFRLTTKQLAFFNRQLASMARLNMPLTRGLKIMAREVTDLDFRQLIERVQQDLEEGKTLQEALTRHPETFTQIHLELLRAGESTGNLAVILEELTRYTDTLHRVRTRLRDAMLYPAVVAGLTVVFILFFFWFVIPQFEGLFAAAGKLVTSTTKASAASGLPLPTRMLFLVSEILRNPLVLVLLFPLAGAAIAYGFVKLKRGWESYDDYMFRLPLFGELIKKATLLKVTRTMRDLLLNGVSMVNALRLTARVAGNNRIRRKLELIRGAVEEGASFSKSLAGDDVFPDTMVWKLQMGEEKGIVEESLSEISNEFELDIDATTTYLTSVISPLMLIAMSIVLMLLMAMLYPQLISIASQVGR